MSDIHLRNPGGWRYRRDDHHIHAEVAGQARGGSGHHAVLDGPAEDSALRLGAERRAGVVPGPGGEGFLPAAR